MSNVDRDDLDAEIMDLCRAVKVVSAIIADQLQYPEGKLETSDYGLETQAYRIDASMVRYAVDHAAGLALSVKDKIIAI